jgi:hypothetical protein
MAIQELTRIPMWIAPFNDVIDDMRRKPFEWHDNDCGPALVGRVVEALTGQNFYDEYRNKYHDAESAYKVMRARGFKDLADLVASYLPEYEHPSEAKIGDIVAIKMDSQFKHALGIMNGETIIVMTPNGIGVMDRSNASRAFRVG